MSVSPGVDNNGTVASKQLTRLKSLPISDLGPSLDNNDRMMMDETAAKQPRVEPVKTMVIGRVPSCLGYSLPRYIIHGFITKASMVFPTNPLTAPRTPIRASCTLHL